MDLIDNSSERSDGSDINEANAKKDRAALGWFGLGVLIGAVATFGVMTIIDAGRAPGVDLAAAVSENASVNTSNTRPFEPVVVGRVANTRGKLNAPVKIIEYGDFECGFCKRFHEQIFQKVIDEYVTTGKASFNYKHFPFLTPSSNWKAEAAECAAEQNRFWDFHDMLFDGKVYGGPDEKGVKDRLIVAAGDLKLDAAAFRACLDEKRTQSRVQADFSEGQQLGVRGTPSFLINGKPLVGAQPYEAFKQAIEAAMAEKPAP